MSSNSSVEPAAIWASTKENPRLPYATGSTGLAITVRGSSRRIMIMRFRPANIRLINRRSNLPRLLLALSSKNNNNDKNNPTDSGELTRSLHIRANHSSRRDAEVMRFPIHLGDKSVYRTLGRQLFGQPVTELRTVAGSDGLRNRLWPQILKGRRYHRRSFPSKFAGY